MHHEIFKAIKKEVDNVLWWINYSFLMLVSSLPFFAELMATFLRTESSVEYIGALCFGLIITGILQLSVWLYILYRRNEHGPNQDLFGTRLLTVMTLALSTTPLVATATFFVALKTDNAVWLLCTSPVIVLMLFALCGAPRETLLDSHQSHKRGSVTEEQILEETKPLMPEADDKPKNL